MDPTSPIPSRAADAFRVTFPFGPDSLLQAVTFGRKEDRLANALGTLGKRTHRTA